VEAAEEPHNSAESLVDLFIGEALNSLFKLTVRIVGDVAGS